MQSQAGKSSFSDVMIQCGFEVAILVRPFESRSINSPSSFLTLRRSVVSGLSPKEIRTTRRAIFSAACRGSQAVHFSGHGPPAEHDRTFCGFSTAESISAIAPDADAWRATRFRPCQSLRQKDERSSRTKRWSRACIQSASNLLSCALSILYRCCPPPEDVRKCVFKFRCRFVE